MYLQDLLPRGRIIVPLAAETLREALDLLIERLAAEGAVHDPEALKGILTPARLSDLVSIGRQVALPHLRTDLVDRLVVALGIAERPLRMVGAAGELAPEIVVLVLAPPGAATLYLQAVSALARLFRQPGVVERICQARSATEILEFPELRGLRIQPRLTVRDIMAHHVGSVTPETPVRDAVDLMVRHRLRAIPVVGEKQEVLGIISEWDIMRALLPHVPRAGGGEVGTEEERVAIPGQLKVREIMSRSVLCISEEIGVDEAANTMINKDVEQFPVVSEGRLTGFLTRGDIIRKLFGR
jgi:CBS domain-containing protein/mannitol/fructose-specific phosphotransferase system IIA component (Ntr-type)